MASLIGQRLGQYEILALLGEGGMAAVYRARQQSIKRDVAVKVIKTGLVQMGDFTRRFEREAQTIASLSQAHIVKVFDYGEHEDLVYLVMELLAGGSLAERIRQGPLSPTVASRIMDQIAEALDYAHQEGIVHRDLKPQNVLFDKSGSVFLTDFGIAKLLNETSALTQSGTALGTPTYMSPEQWRSLPLDGRADIYALGVMLFEMLSGQQPFQADTPLSMMYMHMNEPPPSLRHFRSELPAGVDQVISTALAKDREQRFNTAGQMAETFKAALASQPLRNLPPPPADSPTAPFIPGPLPVANADPVTPAAPPNRSRVLPVIIGAVVLILIGVLAGVVFSQGNTTPPTVTPMPVVIATKPTATVTYSPTVTLQPTIPTATYTFTATFTPIPPSPTFTASPVPPTIPTATATYSPTITLQPTIPTATYTPTTTFTLVPPSLTFTASLVPTASEAWLEVIQVHDPGIYASESLELHNTSGTDINLGGWTIKDKQGHTYTFPRTLLAKDRRITINTRTGTNTAFVLFWNNPTALWNTTDQQITIADDKGNVKLKYSLPVDATHGAPNSTVGAPVPTPTPTLTTSFTAAPSLGATPGEPGATPAASGQLTGTPQAGNGMIIDKVNTAKNHPGDLCAADNASTSFTLVTDTQIYVVASIRNIKKGNDFTASWKGDTGEIYQNKWTATQNTAKDCIAFYIQPQALGMKAGSYSVVFSAGNASSVEIAFTIQ